MWVLVIMSCTLLQCSHVDIRASYKSLSECEAAMVKLYETIEPGQGMICYKKQSDIQT